MKIINKFEIIFHLFVWFKLKFSSYFFFSFYWPVRFNNFQFCLYKIHQSFLQYRILLTRTAWIDILIFSRRFLNKWWKPFGHWNGFPFSALFQGFRIVAVCIYEVVCSQMHTFRSIIDKTRRGDFFLFFFFSFLYVLVVLS